MKIMNKKVVGGAGLMLAMLVAAGCGGGDSGGVDTTAASTDSSSAANSATGSDSGTTGVATPLTTAAVDTSNAALFADVSKESGGLSAANGATFSFPSVSGDAGGFSMTIPAGPAPTFESRRSLQAGNGQALVMGDPVILRYDIFAWNDGALIESSSTQREAVSMQAGIQQNAVPQYLVDSLLGRQLGEVMQVVIPGDAEGVPLPLVGANDAYVVVLELM